MDYILSFLLLLLNLVNYEHRINKVVFFAVGLVLFCALFVFCMAKAKNFLAACIMMLCHTWQISWINIFGDPSTSLQLPWFYLIGVLIAGYALFNIRSMMKTKVGSVLLASFAAIFLIFTYPLATSHSKSEGLKEYIMIGFFLVLTFISVLFSSTVPHECKRHIENAFMFAVAVSAALLIFQFVYYNISGQFIFKFAVGKYNGASMRSAKLLMEDTSCSTLMLGCGVFYMLDRLNKKNWLLYGSMIIVTVVGLAFTTRRTSVVTLMMVLVLYVFFHYKGAMKKALMLAIICGIIAVMITYLLTARPVDDIRLVFDENGRVEYYRNSLEVLLKNPLGIGYDNNYLVDAVGGMVPHNTVLRWLVMGGYPLAVPMTAIMILILREAYVKRFSSEFWIVLYTLIGSNFIPDILNARFFVIPCMTIFLFSRAQAPAPGAEMTAAVPSVDKSLPDAGAAQTEHGKT